MGNSNKFLKEVSKEAKNSNSSAFSKIKDMMSSFNRKKEPTEEEKRKALVEKERKRAMESLKNKPY